MAVLRGGCGSDEAEPGALFIPVDRRAGSPGPMSGKKFSRAAGRPISEMAQEAGLSSSYFTRMLRLSFLAPDITKAILHGHQPADLNAHKLMADTRAPIDWDEQRAGLGFI